MTGHVLSPSRHLRFRRCTSRSHHHHPNPLNPTRPCPSRDELEEQSAGFKKIIFTQLVELKPRGFGAPLTKGFNGKCHGSALHHTGVRSIQAQLHEVMLRMAAHFVDIERRGEDDKKLLSAEILERPAVAATPDCLLARPPQKSRQPRDETLHRDSVHDPSGRSKHDVIWGGWLNANSESDQTFLALPRSHLDADGRSLVSFEKKNGKGFHQLSKEDAAKCRPACREFELKPGFFLVFLERMVHGLAKTPPRLQASPEAKHCMVRAFLGLRLSFEGNGHLYPRLRARQEKRGALPIKGAACSLPLTTGWALQEQRCLLEVRGLVGSGARAP